jgi:PKD repeat protein
MPFLEASGLNQYSLVKIIEHHGNNSCDTDLFDTLNMHVFEVPEMKLNLNYDDLCSPVDVEFEAIDGYYRYTWDFGNGERDITPTSNVSYSYRYDYRDVVVAVEEGDTIYGAPKTDTVFYIQLIADTEFGCTDTLYDSVHVYPNPVADFFVNPEIQNYPDSVIFLINLSTLGNWSYSWEFGDNSGDTLKDPNQHIYDTWGFYDIELKSFSPYCRDSISKRVQILPPPPRALFQPDSIGCPPMDITFRNHAQYADTYFWDFDDGTYSTDFSPTHRFWESKEHHVKMIAYGLSGVDTIEHLVRIHEKPRALFEVYPKEAKNLKQLFKFKNNSINSSYYLWDFGDGNTSPNENPSHIYPDSGTYSVSLYVWSDHDCPDTLIMENVIHVVAGEGNTEFPNAFAWNGSGPTGGHWTEGTIDNTVFHPHLVNATELKMIIYNRWGQKLYETNEVYVGWDGYLKSGELVHPGVYVYKAWVTYVDGLQELLTGDVTFLH